MQLHRFGAGTVFGLFVLLHLSTCTGEQLTFGEYFNNPKSMINGARGGFLLEMYLLPGGAVNAITAYFVSTQPVKIVVWRPRDVARKTYELVREFTVTPTHIGLQTKNLVCGEYIETKDGDRLGIWNEAISSSVGYRITQGTSGVYRYSAKQNEEVPGVVTFGSLAFPYELSLQVHVDTEKGNYQAPCNGALTVPHPTTIPMNVRLNIVPPDKYIGNDLEGTTGLLAGDNRRIYLIKDIRFTESGVVTAFHAYLVGKTPVRFQIWRNTSTVDAYQLIEEYRFDPPDDEVPKYFKVSMDTNETAMHVHAGDVLALSSETDEMSVASSLVTTGSNKPAVLVETLLAGVDYYLRGTTVTFDRLSVPYYFAVGVEYDTETEKYPDPRPFPVTTPKPTDSPDGNNMLQVGEVFPGTLSFPRARRVYIIRNMTLPTNGFAHNFTVNAINTGGLRLQIWRPLDGTATFMLVNEVQLELKSLGITNIPVIPPIEFKKGDVVGFLNEEESGLINYKVFDQSRTNTMEVTSFPRPGQVLSLDALELPHRFSLKLFYEIKEDPPTQPPTTSGPKTGEVKDDMPAWLVDPRFILALFIWLVIITLLLLLLLIYLVCRRREYNDRSRYSSWASGLMPPPQSAYSNWNGDMKDDENIDYFNPTIGSRPRNLASKSNFTNSQRNGDARS